MPAMPRPAHAIAVEKSKSFRRDIAHLLGRGGSYSEHEGDTGATLELEKFLEELSCRSLRRVLSRDENGD